ncbi:hypothetical protein JCM14076_00750 [Methylosoma difficile]
MSNLSLSNQGNGVVLVEGELTFAAIDDQAINALNIANTGKNLVLDLQGITSTDSAGLALMIEWQKQARSKRLPLTFKNIPEQLHNLAKLSGLDNSPLFSFRAEHA